MSTVKISQLPFITEINANTEKTLMAGVDLPSGLTGKISMRTLAARLYSNDVLNVGINPIIYENVAAQFTESSSVFIQTSLKNTDGLGSADYVAYANNSSGSNNFVDMGVNGPAFNDPIYTAMKPYDGYLFNYGPSAGDYRGNLVIGTASANAHVKFIAGGTLEENIVGQFNHSLYEFYNPISVTGDIVNTGNVYTDSIIFGDGSIQEGSSVARLDAAFLKANNALANTGNATFGYHLSVPDTLTANLMIVTGLQQFLGNAVIRTATGTGNFKNINILTGDEISTGNSGSIDITTGSSGAVSGFSGDIVLNIGEGTSGNGKIYLVGDIEIGTGEHITYLNGNVRVSNNLTWGDGSYIDLSDKLNIASQNDLQIKTNLGGATKSWNFTANGDLTLPGDLNLNYNGTLAATLQVSNSYISLTAEKEKSIFFGVTDTDDTFRSLNLGFDGNLDAPGDLTVAGNIIASSISTSKLVSFISSTTPATNSLVELIGSSSGLQQTPSNDGYMLHITGKDDIPTRVIFDAFGANSYPLIAGRKGRGVAGAPTATANGDILLRISSNGWGTTGFAPLGSGRIDFVATENYTDTARGSRIDLFNCADGSNTIVRIASFNSDTVEFTGSVRPDKGFVYTPRILTGPQTAITVDFSNDSIIKASLDNNLTLSFANYTFGKIVEVWLTNTSGSNRTVTHGCSATNSSDNATTFTIPATSSAYLRYFSLDGDLANTFVTSVHA